ncbi:outer membrane protein [Legionella pneumophila]|uniref:outer membrane protein n=1 Tax=Legionella pneumophila TaxID=446 RepID=UPI000875D615|nr:porin family protein [Legionella pneumophila]AOW59448.1 hypothetical protein BE843_14825 [Legionella pneumophila subsp. pneumophila]AOW60364.1 hypothetical protein BE844_03950 [Legionella pneumophila subsp. pneumophila]AOW65762.1 hypothetical protein BE846_01715 [Legionella pneumophila subsp. pneumophila]HEE0245793.1 porin family protein [Legionella pneumophila]
MKKSSLVLATAASLLAGPALAGVIGDVAPKDWTWVGTLSAGPVWANAGDTQTFYLAPEIEKTYAAVKENNTFVAGEVFAGIQKTWPSQWLGQLGLALATTGNASLQGVIWDDADPEFNNHSYQYKVRNTRIAAKGKLLLDKSYWLIPWVSASLGVGFNQAREYSNTPLIFEALPNPNFTNHTKTALTYTLGAGVQKTLSHHWQAGVGYEFADWGRSELGRAFGQTMNSGLALNHLYTNGVLLNLTYIA